MSVVFRSYYIIQGDNSRSTKSRAIRVSQKVSTLNMCSGVYNAVNPMFT